MAYQLAGQSDFGDTLTSPDGLTFTLPRGIADPSAFAPLPGAGAADVAPGLPEPAPPAQIEPPAPAPIEPAAPAPQPAPAQPAGQAQAPAAPPPAANEQPVDAFQASAIGQQDAYDQAIDAEMAKGDIAAQEAQARASVLQARDAKLAELEAQRQQQAAADQAERAKLEQKYAAAVDAEAAWKMDRGRYWSKTSTGQKIGFAIGMALSGIGAALNKQQGNGALDLLMGFIDQDAQDQMVEHDNLAKRIGLAGAQADRFKALAADRAGEFTLRRATALEAAAREVEVMASQYAAPAARAHAAGLAAALRGEKASALGKFAEGEWGRDMQQRQFDEQVRARKAAAAAAAAARRDAAARDARDFAESQRRFDIETANKAAAMAAAGQADAAKMYIEQRKLEIPGATLKDGKPLTARTEKEAQATREVLGATHQIVGLVDDMEALIKKEGGISAALKSPEYQRITSMAAQLDNALRVGNQMGALDNGALKMMELMKGGASMTGWQSFLSSDASHGLDEVRRGQVAKFNTLLKAQDTNASVYAIDKPTAPTATADEQALRALTADSAKVAPSASDYISGLGGVGGMNARRAASSAFAGGLTPAQSQAIDALVAAGNYDALGQAMKSPNRAIAEAAKAAMQRAGDVAKDKTRSGMYASFGTGGS